MGNCSSKAQVAPPQANPGKEGDSLQPHILSADSPKTSITSSFESVSEEKNQVSNSSKPEIIPRKLLLKAPVTSEKYEVILWGMQPSANSSVIRAFLALSGITFKEEEAWGRTRTPEYIEKFPSNLSPAIECQGKYIFECVAIMKFLCRTYPKQCGRFYPESDIQKLTTIDWLCDYITMGILLQLPKAVYPTLRFDSNPGDVASLQSTKPFTKMSQEVACNYILDTLNSKYVGVFLGNSKYLLSDYPTIADYRFAPMINFIKVGCVIPERLQKYYDDMTRLPGFVKACQPVVDFASPHWKK